MPFHLTKKAYKDLKGIAIYTKETWGNEQCELYLRTMDEAFQRVSETPQMGRSIGEIRNGYFKYPVGKHLLFYRLIYDDEVQIVRILHQKMDVSSRKLEGLGFLNP